MQGPTRITFEKLKDPQVADAYQAMIGGKFAPLTTARKHTASKNST